MEAYRCAGCGVISPLTDSNGKPIPIDKPCFKCGCKNKTKVKLPNFPATKKGRRRRFRGGGIKHIGL